MRTVRAVPGGHGAPGGGTCAAHLRPYAGERGGRALAARRDRHVHEGRLDLRPRTDRVRRRGHRHQAGGVLRMNSIYDQPGARQVELEIDGEPVSVREGATILDACRKVGIDTPTLCYGETLAPANVCRVCVVELEGARALVPACSRLVEPGMKVLTDSERVRHSRKMVMEFLGSSVDLTTAPEAQLYVQQYGADTARYGPPAPPDTER